MKTVHRDEKKRAGVKILQTDDRIQLLNSEDEGENNLNLNKIHQRLAYPS
jgi:hypothetical protein